MNKPSWKVRMLLLMVFCYLLSKKKRTINVLVKPFEYTKYTAKVYTEGDLYYKHSTLKTGVNSSKQSFTIVTTKRKGNYDRFWS